jgi:hypothetical protein
MSADDEVTGSLEGKSLSALTARRSRGDIAVYREDDSTFKKRLKENLMDHWLLNTIATLIIFVVVFYLITGEVFIGLVAGMLVLIVSNLSNVLWKIRDFERWEIFSNGVKLGYDPKGKVKFVRFSDIEGLEVRKGLRGEVMIIDLGDRKIKYPYRYNKDVFDLLQHKYDAFQEIQRAPVVDE